MRNSSTQLIYDPTTTRMTVANITNPNEYKPEGSNKKKGKEGKEAKADKYVSAAKYVPVSKFKNKAPEDSKPV